MQYHNPDNQFNGNVQNFGNNQFNQNHINNQNFIQTQANPPYPNIGNNVQPANLVQFHQQVNPNFGITQNQYNNGTIINPAFGANAEQNNWMNQNPVVREGAGVMGHHYPNQSFGNS